MNIDNINRLIEHLEKDDTEFDIKSIRTCFFNSLQEINSCLSEPKIEDKKSLDHLTMPLGYYNSKAYPKSRAINALKALRDGKEITPTWEGIES